MAISYNRLWKLLIDKDLNKTDLRKMAGLGQATIAKLVKGENVTTDVLNRICSALECSLNDIAEYNPDININEEKNKNETSN